MNWIEELEINDQIWFYFSPCWPEVASSGAACPHHSSLREVVLLSLGEVQECSANTNGYRSFSGVFSWQGMHWAGKHYCSVCSLQWDYSASIPLYVLSKPCFWYIQLYFLLYTKRDNMHEQDTLPLHGKHCSAMNKQIETVSKQLHFYFLKSRGGEKWHEVKFSKQSWVQSIFMESLH